jgi:heterotetrameric sarcosine oxidase gamma subunit
MSDLTMRRHGLEAFLATAGDADAEDTAVHVSVRDDLCHINLRGDPANEEFTAAIENVIGQPLPVIPNTLTTGSHHVFWLGPDEWLIVTTADDVAELVARLSEATSSMHAAVNDISGGQVALSLKGHNTRELLAKGCTLDLHAAVFSAGRCAQTGLAKANILLACLDDTQTFIIVVRRSFSDYLCRWLHSSGQAAGIRFQEV